MSFSLEQENHLEQKGEDKEADAGGKVTCEFCGGWILVDSNFCRHCGSSLNGRQGAVAESKEDFLPAEVKGRVTFSQTKMHFGLTYPSAFPHHRIQTADVSPTADSSKPVEEKEDDCLMCGESFRPSQAAYGLLCPTGEFGPCGGSFACRECLSEMVLSQCANMGDFTNNGRSAKSMPSRLLHP